MMAFYVFEPIFWNIEIELSAAIFWGLLKKWKNKNISARIVIKHPKIMKIMGRYDPNIIFENINRITGTQHIFRKDYGSSFILVDKTCLI